MKKVFLKFFGGAMLIVLIASSCKKTTDVALPPIGGFNNSGEVGKTDLVAYWPLNGDGNESISGTTPAKTLGVTFDSGIKDKCLKLSDGYMLYPEISKLNTLNDLSISMWINLSTNKGTSNEHATSLFQLTRVEGAGTHWAGNFTALVETANFGGDTLQIKGLTVTKDAKGATNWQDIVNSPKATTADIQDGHTQNANKVGGTWSHVTITWESLTKTFKIYSNGVKISDAKYELRTGSPGALDFFLPTKPLIGAFGTNIEGGLGSENFAKPMTGSIDEIRIWKKTLGAQEIDALYQLEKAGR